MRPVLALAAATAALAFPLAATAQECAIPDLLVALDTSGSMSEPGGDGRTKWESAVDAVGRMATSYDSSIRWGLELFPGNEQCSAGYIAVPIAATGADVRSALARAGPGGGTPIAESLAVARQHLAATNDGRPHYVLLVTDGQPNCNGNLDWQSCDCTCSGDPRCTCQEYAYNCLDDRRTQDELAALAADGVPTFVVGFGAGVNPAVLNALAGAGGTARPGGVGYYDASDTRSLAAALDAIAAELVTRPCSSACGPGVETCTEQGWQGCSAPQQGDVRPCGDGFEGVCGTGEQSCGASGWSECSAATPGTSRVCHTACGDGVETCLDGGKWTGCVGAAEGDQQECESGCGTGLAACQEEGWGACFGEAGVNGCGTCGAPPAEECNGIDDDCDGVIDDGLDLAACGSRGCSEGACRQPCFESSCPSDELCNDEFFCVPRPCEGGCGELTCTATGCADPLRRGALPRRPGLRRRRLRGGQLPRPRAARWARPAWRGAASRIPATTCAAPSASTAGPGRAWAPAPGSSAARARAARTGPAPPTPAPRSFAARVRPAAAAAAPRIPARSSTAPAAGSAIAAPASPTPA